MLFFLASFIQCSKFGVNFFLLCLFFLWQGLWFKVMGELVKHGSPAEKLSGYPAEKLTGLVWFDVIDRQWSSTSPFRVTTYTVLHCILNIFFCFLLWKGTTFMKEQAKWTQSPEMTGKWAMRKSPLCDFDYIMHFWRGKLTWNVVYCWYSCAFPLVTSNHIFNKQILMRHYKL